MSPMDFVAPKVLARQALQRTEVYRPTRQELNLLGAKTSLKLLKEESAEQAKAIRYVLEHGVPYRPLIEKYARASDWPLDMNYYNEFDPHAAAWLRALIAGGHIPPGFVDERSIEDVRPDELLGYTQCHFFAGIGGWPLALRLAGWPDDKPVWTGSCPCQPFSAAGKGAGFDDERHLWPSFQWLIQQCRPTTVFGEQVASKATGPWFDLVQTDLEALGYAFGLAAFPASSVGAPHIRDRAYWVGHGEREGLERQPRHVNGTGGRAQPAGPTTATSSAVRVADDAERGRREKRQDAGGRDAGSGAQERAAGRVSGGTAGRLADNEPEQYPHRKSRVGNEHETGGREQGSTETTGLCSDSRLADVDHQRLHGVNPPVRCKQVDSTEATGRGEASINERTGRGDGICAAPYSAGGQRTAGPVNGHWRDADWLLCRDGKWRPVEPGTFPLADGLPRGVVPSGDPCAPGYAENTSEARVMRLKGYGNAIVPQQAAEFVLSVAGGKGFV